MGDFRGGLPCAAKIILCGDPLANAVFGVLRKAVAMAQRYEAGQAPGVTEEAMNALLASVQHAETLAKEIVAGIDEAFAKCVEQLR